DRAVADDERDRGRKRIGNRARERVASPGHERDMDTATHTLVDRVTVLLRHPSAAIQQSPVHVHANEPNHLLSMWYRLQDRPARDEVPLSRYEVGPVPGGE